MMEIGHYITVVGRVAAAAAVTGLVAPGRVNVILTLSDHGYM